MSLRSNSALSRFRRSQHIAELLTLLLPVLRKDLFNEFPDGNGNGIPGQYFGHRFIAAAVKNKQINERLVVSSALVAHMDKQNH